LEFLFSLKGKLLTVDELYEEYINHSIKNILYIEDLPVLLSGSRVDNIKGYVPHDFVITSSNDYEDEDRSQNNEITDEEDEEDHG